MSFHGPSVEGAVTLSTEEYQTIVDIERVNHANGHKFSNEGRIDGRWSFDDDDFVWFIEKQEGRVVAYALLDTERSDFVYLYDLGVDRKHQRKGLGGRLMRDIVEWKKKDGRKMVLKVAFDNKGAQRLYRSFGFVPSVDDQRPNGMPIQDNFLFMHRM